MTSLYIIGGVVTIGFAIGLVHLGKILRKDARQHLQGTHKDLENTCDHQCEQCSLKCIK